MEYLPPGTNDSQVQNLPVTDVTQPTGGGIVAADAATTRQLARAARRERRALVHARCNSEAFPATPPLSAKSLPGAIRRLQREHTLALN